VFKTIKYGVPQKGMIAWQQKLKPEEIQNVSSYILSLQGTKPANAKEPQGEPVVPQEGAADKLSMK
jgi:cytochrome c oxidase cbb3-type subunit 3